jgi:hypothetical protein
MSWRKYGGTNKLEKNNNVTVNSIVADTFTIRDAFLSVFKVQGDLTILGHGSISQSMTVEEHTYTSYLDVSNNATIYDRLYLDKQRDVFFKGSSGMIGLNTITPTATFDISTNLLNALNIKSSSVNNRNILARNSHNNGIALIARNNTDTAVQFYSSNTGTIDISSNPNAEIRYVNASNQLIIDTVNDIKLASKVWVTDRETLGNIHIHNETIVVYDTPNITTPIFYSDVYDNPMVKQGNAMSLISTDNTSNTMLNITTPNKLGLQLGGGAYPNDLNRSMGILDVYNPISVYNNSFNLDTSAPPAQMIVTGNSLVKSHTTTGFNTYAPKVDTYVVDINGALHINNGEIALTYKPTNRIYSMFINGVYGIAVGSFDVTSATINGSYAGRYYAYYTTNGGESWNRSIIYTRTLEELSPRNFRALHSINVGGTITSIIGCENAFTFISIDGGVSWTSLLNQIPLSPTITAVYLATASVMYMGYSGGFTYGTYTLNGSEYTPSSRIDVPISGFATSDCAGNGQKLIFVGGNQRRTYSLDISYLNPTATYSTQTNIPEATYNAVKMFNATYAIAVGINIISYTNNAGQSWTDVNLTAQSVVLNDVHILNVLNAVAVGNNGIMYITYDGAVTWRLVDIDTLNASGMGTRIVNTFHHLTSVYMTNIDTFVVSSVPTSPTISSDLFYLHMPNIFNRSSNYVMDVSGSIRMSGDLHMNDEGRIITNNSIFNIATTSRTINIGKLNMTFPDNGNVIINNAINVTTGNIVSLSVPTSLTVGTTGNTTLYNTMASTNTATGALQVRGGIGLNGNMFIGNGGKVTIMNPTNVYIDPSNNPTGLTGEALLLMGGTRIMGNVGVMGTLALGNAIPSSSIYTGALRVKGGIGVEGSLYVGGQVFTTGGVLTNSVQNEPYQNKSPADIILTGTSAELTGGISSLGGVSVKLRLWVGGDVITNGVVNIRNSTNSTNTATGALQVYGGAGIGGNINTTGIIQVKNCTESTNTATGALQVCGGIGVSGNIITGGSITTGGIISAMSACISGSLTVGSISTLKNVSISVSTASTNTATGALAVTGGVGVGGNANIGGVTQIMNTSASTNTATGALQVRGGLGITGNIIVGGAQTIVGSLSVAGFRSTADSIVVGTLNVSTLNVNGSNMNTLLTGGTTMIGGGTSTTLSGTALVLDAQTISGFAYIRVNEINKAVFDNSNTTLTQNNNINMTAGGALQIQSNGVNVASNGPIQISGATTLSSATRITNTTTSTNTATGALVVTGGTGIGGDVYVSGITTLSNQVFASSISLANSMSVGGSTTLNDTLITNTNISTSTATGALRIVGGVGIGGNLFVGGSISSASGIGGGISLSGFNSTANSTISGSLAVTSGVTSTNTATGALKVSGGFGISGDMNIGGNIIIQNPSTNTRYGYLALVNTTGGSNVATGYQALNANTTGDYNTAIGSEALRFNTTAGSNTAMGYFALRTNITGTGNLAVGYNALYLNTGSSNTAIGSNAGSTLTTGANNIMIGYNATPSSITVSNEITIGNASTGIIRATTTNTTLPGVLTTAGFNSTVNSTVNASLWVTGSQTITGSETISGNLIVVGGYYSGNNSTVNGSLQVTGSQTISGNLIVVGGYYSGNNSTVNGSLQITGSQTISGNLIVVGGYYSGNNSTVAGALVVTSGIASTNTATGALLVTGGVGITGNVFVGGSITSASNVSGSVTLSGFNSTANSTIAGSLAVTGNQNIAGLMRMTSGIASTNTATGALLVSGGVGIGGNLYTTGIKVEGVNTGGGVQYPPYAIGLGFTNSGINTIYTYNGTTWTGKGNTIFSSYGYHACWNGTIWVAVGTGTNSIATSTDGGVSWLGRGQTIFSVGHRVVWAASLNVWVAVGGGTFKIATSPDGIVWTGRGASIFSSYGFGIDWNGTVFIAGGQGGNSIATSTDGINWFGKGIGSSTNGTALVYWSSALNIWIASRDNTIPSFMTSTDNGNTWVNATGGNYMTCLAWDGTRFISGGDSGGTGSTWTSTNGTAWTSTGTSPNNTTLISGIEYISGKWVAVGQGSNTVSISSDNGATWTGLGVTLFPVAGKTLSYNSISTVNPIYIDATNTATGALQIMGGAGMRGNLCTGGIVDILNTTASTDTATGALQVFGGVGIGGNVNIGGSIIMWNSVSTNLAYGYKALNSNTNGVANTAIGYNSMLLNTTGSNNVATGRDAGLHNISGSNNTYIGALADINGNSFTNATVIGYNATGTASNQITLGNLSVTALRCQVTTITALSDERDKKEIRDLEMGMDFVKGIRPVRFMWNMRDKGKIDIPEIGFIAQELIEAGGKQIPNLIDDTDEDKLMVGQTAMFPVLVKAVQELNTKLDIANTTIGEQDKIIQQLVEDVKTLKASAS